MDKPREELLKSPDYWLAQLQLNLYDMVESYLEENHMSRKEFAEKLGVSRSYVSQLLAGDFDNKLSKLVQLALACDKIPSLNFSPLEKAEEIQENNYYNNYQNLSLKNVQYIAPLSSMILNHLYKEPMSENLKPKYSDISSQHIFSSHLFTSDWCEKSEKKLEVA